MGFERVLPDPKDIRALAAQNRTLHLAAGARAPSNPADRNACLGARADDHFRFDPPRITLIQDALGHGKQRRIDRARADDLANLAHRSARGRRR